MSHECGECGEPPAHPGSVVRVIGRTRDGRETELCSKCFIEREREAAVPAPTLADVKPPKQGKRKRR